MADDRSATFNSDDPVVLPLHGVIGMTAIEILDAQLARIADQKPKLVVVDLSAVTMIASSAMGSLIGFRRELSRSGGAVVLAGITPQIGESLKRANLHMLFKICATVSEALASAASRGTPA